MNITYQHSLPDEAQFAALFETTGWNDKYHCQPQELYEALQKSWHAVSAYDGERLVGFGRAISDGILHAFIVEMIVAPDHRLGCLCRDLRGNHGGWHGNGTDAAARDRHDEDENKNLSPHRLLLEKKVLEYGSNYAITR